MKMHKSIGFLRNHFKIKMQNDKHTTIKHISFSDEHSENEDICVQTDCGSWYISRASYWKKYKLTKLFIRNKVTVHYPISSILNNENFYVDNISPDLCVEIFNTLEAISQIFIILEQFIIINGGKIIDKNYTFDVLKVPKHRLFFTSIKGEYKIIAEIIANYDNKDIAISISYTTVNNYRGKYEAIINGLCINFHGTHILIMILNYVIESNDAKKQFVRNYLNEDLFETMEKYKTFFRGSLNSKQFGI